MAIFTPITNSLLDTPLGSVETCSTVCFYNIWVSSVVLSLPSLSWFLWFPFLLLSNIHCSCQCAFMWLPSCPLMMCCRLKTSLPSFLGIVLEGLRGMLVTNINVHLFLNFMTCVLSLRPLIYWFLCCTLNRWSSFQTGSF